MRDRVSIARSWLLPLAQAALLTAFGASWGSLDAQSPDRLDAWRQAIELHVPGTADAPALEVASWTMEGLDAALAGLARDARERMSPEHASRVLKRAALLHTDIALLDEENPSLGQDRSSRRSSQALTVQDGELGGYQRGSDHWPFARRILDHLRPSPSRDPAVRDWYRSVAAHLVDRHNYGELRWQLVRGRELWPGDAVLAMLEGVRHQTLASARVQASLHRVAGPRGRRGPVGLPGEELGASRKAYHEALRLDPGLVEARVRLGRVLADLGQTQEAAEQLRVAVAAADEPVLLYLADLFLGEQEALLGRVEAARAAYESASRRFPKAQSPHLALSRLARSRGQRAEALEELDRALALPSDPVGRADPWRSFLDSAGRRADQSLADVRRALVASGEP